MVVVFGSDVDGFSTALFSSLKVAGSLVHLSHLQFEQVVGLLLVVLCQTPLLYLLLCPDSPLLLLELCPGLLSNNIQV